MDPRERLIEELLDRKRREQQQDQEKDRTHPRLRDFGETESLVQRLLAEHGGQPKSSPGTGSGGKGRGASATAGGSSSSYGRNGGGTASSSSKRPQPVSKFESAQLYLKSQENQNVVDQEEMPDNISGFKFYKEQQQNRDARQDIEGGTENEERFDKDENLRIPAKMQEAASRTVAGANNRNQRPTSVPPGRNQQNNNLRTNNNLQITQRISHQNKSSQQNSRSRSVENQNSRNRISAKNNRQPVMISDDKPLPLEERAVLWANQYKRGLERRAKLKQQQEEEEMRNFTFRPQRGPPPPGLSSTAGGATTSSGGNNNYNVVSGIRVGDESPHQQSTIYQYAAEHTETVDERFDRLHHEADQRERIRQYNI